MAWIILEGIDRTGKSSVCELYRKQGYEVFHFKAPDKKYADPGYAGPSYVDEILDLYMQFDNKDVVFDRSIYGEVVWPHVYGRKSMLTEDDIDMLREFEDRNSTSRILMVDPNTAAHWQRCVDNKEPLNQHQFKIAGSLFNKMAHKYGFIPRQLNDFIPTKTETEDNNQDSTFNKHKEENKEKESSPVVAVRAVNTDNISTQNVELEKLDKANAIKDVLSKRLIKQKGGAFDKLEEDIKVFLKNQLSNIFSEKPSQVSLSEDEITVLKVFCQRLKEKGSK